MLARALSQARLPLYAIAILAVLAFTSFTSLRPSLATNDFSSVAPASAVPALVVQGAASIDTTACGGRYVTGDLVGDASPAAVYATMCGGR
jgi:hypothetical protein